MCLQLRRDAQSGESGDSDVDNVSEPGRDDVVTSTIASSPVLPSTSGSSPLFVPTSGSSGSRRKLPPGKIRGQRKGAEESASLLQDMIKTSQCRVQQANLEVNIFVLLVYCCRITKEQISTHFIFHICALSTATEQRSQQDGQGRMGQHV